MRKKLTKSTALPFWSWNDKLDKDKLIRQIQDMKKDGYGGFFMHARSGLKTEYLGKEWFDCVRACCEEAKKLGMQAWAYDENGWPSGFVGGKLLENKEFRSHSLTANIGDFDKNADFHYFVNGKNVTRSEKERKGVFVNVFDNESVSMTDVMSDDMVDAFIAETHEKYKAQLGGFNDNIVGFFTDEPQYAHAGFPFSKKIPEYFQSVYGENVFDYLGLLFVNGKGYEKFRYRYFKCCQALFLKNFAQKLYTWHDENGLKMTGHYVEERCLFTQMFDNAGIMPFYEFLHIPGIDWLCRRYLWVSCIRQLTSVTAQLKKEFALTETFAMTGWDVTPKELKSIADYQYNYGVNLMCFHLLPYSERGERKNDYPTHFTPFNAWYKKGINEFNKYFDALGQWIRDSKERVHVGVLCTIRSAYLDYDYRAPESVEPVDESYIETCQNLAINHVAFHILDETLLAKYGGVREGEITLGACRYDTLVIPNVIVMDGSTEKILKEFINQGGKVVLTGGKPTLSEGEPYDFGYLESNVSMNEIYAENDYTVLSDYKFLHTSLRRVDGKDYIFAVNIGEEETVVGFTVGTRRFNAVYDVVTGNVRHVGNNFVIPPKESVIACEFEGEIPMIPSFETIDIGSDEYKVSDFNTNYLVLDFAGVSYDGVNYEKPLPVVGIFRRLLEERYRGAIYLKYSFQVKRIPAQASLLMEDADKISAELNGRPLVFDGKSDLDEIYSVADIADKTVVGENVLIVKYDFYQNENVYYALFGEGVTESIKNCMTYDTTFTAPFVAGKFGVYSDNFRKGYSPSYVHADSFYIDKAPVKATNLVEQGFPFFAGNITLQTEFVTTCDNVVLKFNGRFHYAEVSVNGKNAGTLLFTDKIDVSDYAVKGKNILSVKLYSGNRNLLGPHHTVNSDTDTEVVPSSFDFSESWSGNGSPDFTARYSFSLFGLFDKI